MLQRIEGLFPTTEMEVIKAFAVFSFYMNFWQDTSSFADGFLALDSGSLTTSDNSSLQDQR
jgi:hypothetical protein